MQLFPQPPQNQQPSYIPQDVPVYRLTEEVYMDDELHTPYTHPFIAYGGEPNKAMVPVNELAQKRMREFLTKLDDLGRKAAEKAGVAYISELDSFEVAFALARQEGKQVTVLNSVDPVPVGLEKNRRGRPKKVQVINVPQGGATIKTIGSEKDDVNAVSETNL